MMRKLRKTPKEKLQASIKSILADKPVQVEIDKGLITVKDEKGDYLFAIKGKVKIESTLRVPECEKCNSEGRKKELEALETDKQALDRRSHDMNEREERLVKREDAFIEREQKLIKREIDIKAAIKTLQG